MSESIEVWVVVAVNDGESIPWNEVYTSFEKAKQAVIADAMEVLNDCFDEEDGAEVLESIERMKEELVESNLYEPIEHFAYDYVQIDQAVLV